MVHFLSDKNGLARYDLGATRIVSADGEVIEGNPIADYVGDTEQSDDLTMLALQWNRVAS